MNPEVRRTLQFILDNEAKLLKDFQTVGCVPCGGTKVNHVYRCPEAAQLAAMVREILGVKS